MRGGTLVTALALVVVVVGGWGTGPLAVHAFPYMAASALAPVQPPSPTLECAAAAKVARRNPYSSFTPQCDDDGLYAPLQCWIAAQMCWCVEPNGSPVRGLSAPLSFGPLLRCPAGDRVTTTTTAPPRATGDGPVTKRPRKLPQVVEQLLDLPLVGGPGFAGSDRVLFSGNTEEKQTGARQLFAVEVRGGGEGVSKKRQVTHFEDSVGGFAARPHHKDEIVVLTDRKGNEHFQLTLLDLATSRQHAITDNPAALHSLGGFTACGTSLNYLRIEEDDAVATWTLVVYNIEDDTHTDVAVFHDPCTLSAGPFSASNSHVVVEVVSATHAQDSDLVLVDVRGKEGEEGEEGERVVLTAHDPDTNPSQWSVGGARFHPAHDLLYVLTDDGQDFVGLQIIHTRSLRRTMALTFNGASIDHISITPTVSHAAVTVNRNGFAEFHVFTVSEDGFRFDELRTPLHHRGLTVHPLRLSTDGSRAVYMHDAHGKTEQLKLLRVTEGRVEAEADLEGGYDLPETIAALPTPYPTTYPSFDNEPIPAYILPPVPQAGNKQRGSPYVLLIHGGPKSQSGPKLLSNSRSLSVALEFLRTKGVGVLIPNVRGSTGYGKRFASLDLQDKRPAAVKDVLEGVRFVCSLPGADCDRVAIVGGSYGGWMTLEAISRAPRTFAAAIDLFGMSNLETFMQTTAPHRRQNRRLEYGLTAPLLRELSPIHRACDITCPVMVMQGQNDIRVPASESKQMVDAVNKCGGGRAEGVVFQGEGHGFKEMSSKQMGAAHVVEFLTKHLGLEDDR